MRYDAQAVVEPVERAVGVKLAFWRGTGLQQLGEGLASLGGEQEAWQPR